MSFPAIYGATPIDDTSGLKLDISTLKELSEVEKENIAKPIFKYLVSKPSTRIAPFDVEWSLKLHGEMYDDVWEWAGSVRTRDGFNIGVPAHTIREELLNLFKDLHAWKEDEMDLTEQAAHLHHRAVWIHPFQNGNGRWARLLTDIWLKQNGATPTSWPQDLGVESPIREEYINAVKAADQQDIVPLLKLHEKYSIKE